MTDLEQMAWRAEHTRRVLGLVQRAAISCDEVRMMKRAQAAGIELDEAVCERIKLEERLISWVGFSLWLDAKEMEVSDEVVIQGMGGGSGDE